MRCAGRTLDLSRPVVMGVLNVTPDSFSDGGRFADPRAALAQAEAMVAAGARIIDVGGESTRPGAAPVGEQEEMDRVLPVIEALRADPETLISVDTMKSGVMCAALAAGAHLVNDVRALRGPGALEAVAASEAGVCLMHMQGEPRSMQANPVYADVVGEVRDFLARRVADCEAAGIGRDRIVLDPGFGFGKTLAHNLALLAGLARIVELGCPVLVGLSRKSMLGKLLGREPQHRLAGSLALAAIAVMQGARIVRAHDVVETLDAVRVAGAVLEAGGNS